MRILGTTLLSDMSARAAFMAVSGRSDATNNPDNTYIFVGKDGGGTNPGCCSVRADDPGHARSRSPYPGSDPRQFIPTGPEYECQVVNPQFATRTATRTQPARRDAAAYTLRQHRDESRRHGRRLC